MKLHEYQSKQIFARYGIPIPKGRVATTASEARQIADELGGRVVIKAQVLVGGRGKAGGVRVAKNADEAEQLAAQILAMEIKGLPVRKVLVDEAASIDQEIYLGIINDRSAKAPVIIASSAGGVEIEEVVKLGMGPLPFSDFVNSRQPHTSTIALSADWVDNESGNIANFILIVLYLPGGYPPDGSRLFYAREGEIYGQPNR